MATSITVLDAQRQQHTIRVAGIDTPERSRPFGKQAKEQLAYLVFNKPVRVEWNKLDVYKRIIGKIWVALPHCPRCSPSLDAGLVLVSNGMAWWFRRYAEEQSPADRLKYESAENDARARRLGLWRDPDPIPPWDWRKMKKSRDGKMSG